jgi:hypothetical protein
MILKSAVLRYNIQTEEDEKNFHSEIKLKIKEISEKGYHLCGFVNCHKNNSFYLVYETAFKRNVLTEKNKNISEEKLEEEIIIQVNRHCIEKIKEERRKEQMLSENLSYKSFFGNIFDKNGMPIEKLTVICGKQ